MSLDINRRVADAGRPAGPAPHVLASGASISLRPARSRDLDALRSLAARNGIVCEDLELARLVRSAAGDRLVLCATTVAEGIEQVVGVGVIEFGRWSTMPSLVLVDPAVGEGLARLIADALIERARELAAAGQVA
jgi:hypothetical protein